MRSRLKVITPAPSYDMTVLDTLKAELKITNTTNDIELSQLITRASFIVAEITGRIWAKEEVEERIYIRPGEIVPTLVLKRRPVLEASPSLLTVTENGNDLTEDVDFFVDYDKGMLHRLNGRHWIFSNNPSVVVHYTGGFEMLDDLPYGLEQATLILARGFWLSSSRDPNIRSETTFEIDSVTYQNMGDLQKSVESLLDIYADPGWA